MSPQIIIAAVIAAMGFASGFGVAWKIQAGNINEKEAQHAKQELANVRQSAAADVRRLDNTIAAQNRSASRAVALRRDLDSARTELGRLRLAVARAMPSACDASTPGVERAVTGNQLLLECAAEITDLAGKADRHASDVKTLMEAWPAPSDAKPITQ